MNQEDEYPYDDFLYEPWDTEKTTTSSRAQELEDELEESRRSKSAPRRVEDYVQKSYERVYGDDEANDDSEREISDIRREMKRLQERLNKAEAAQAEKLLTENRELQKKVKDAENLRDNFISELSFFLGEKLAEEKPASFEDVEAWAYQDGRNDIILAVQNWVSKVKETQDAINEPERLEWQNDFISRALNKKKYSLHDEGSMRSF